MYCSVCGSPCTTPSWSLYASQQRPRYAWRCTNVFAPAGEVKEASPCAAFHDQILRRKDAGRSLTQFLYSTTLQHSKLMVRESSQPVPRGSLPQATSSTTTSTRDRVGVSSGRRNRTRHKHNLPAFLCDSQIGPNVNPDRQLQRDTSHAATDTHTFHISFLPARQRFFAEECDHLA